jgi:hypothetical protein
MHRMEVSLRAAGYRVCNIDYPSREHAIAVLAEKYVGPKVAECLAGSEEPPNFVTHSLGGIIVRRLAATGEVRNFGRVVMLGPPNHGSEVVDSLGSWELFKAINGPAGNELGTSAGSVPLRLGPAPNKALQTDKVSRHASCIRKSHASLPLPLSLIVSALKTACISRPDAQEE